MLKALSLAVVLGSVVSATFVGASQPKVVPQPPVEVRFVTNGEANKARYRVRERLVGKELENDAVGETPVVSGTIALDRQGRVIATQSGFTADVSKLKSDEARRDRYVKNRILRLDSFPITTFRATEVKGLSVPLPKNGKTSFQLVGDLTVKGVTRPSTWTVTATVNGEQLSGQAVTKFTFKEFGILQPKVPVLLSVADTITLEYDFAMVREPVAVVAPAPAKATKK